jgi:hypothetical protein
MALARLFREHGKVVKIHRRIGVYRNQVAKDLAEGGLANQRVQNLERVENAARSVRDSGPGTAPAPAPPFANGTRLGLGFPPPPVKQPVIAVLLEALAPAPHVPLADPDELRCLPPRDLVRHSPQKRLPVFSLPAPWRPSSKKPCLPWSPTSPPEMRTDHLLTRPDISCANDSTYWHTCHAGRPRANVRRSIVLESFREVDLFHPTVLEGFHL